MPLKFHVMLESNAPASVRESHQRYKKAWDELEQRAIDRSPELTAAKLNYWEVYWKNREAIRRKRYPLANFP